MTPLNASQVQQSFRCLLPYSDELAEAIFLRLVRAKPGLAPLFLSESAAQRRRFMAGLAFAIETLDDFGNMTHGLHAFGATCRRLGLGETEIGSIRTALIDTVGQALGGAARGTRWTPELRAAWTEAAVAMTAAMRQPAPETGAPERQAAA